MNVEVSLVGVHDRWLSLMVRDYVDLATRLSKVDVTIDLLIWIALNTVFCHFLCVSNLRTHVAQHSLDSCLPVLLVVLIFDLLHDCNLFRC